MDILSLPGMLKQVQHDCPLPGMVRPRGRRKIFK